MNHYLVIISSPYLWCLLF